MDVIQTPRLSLQPMDEADAGFMLRLLNAPTWLRHIGDRGVRTLDDARHYIRNGALALYARYGFGPRVIRLIGEADPLGICGLFRRDYLDAPDIGFALLPEYGGRGYAREAARAVLDDARDRLALPRIVATVRPDNPRSAALLSWLGMVRRTRFLHPEGDRHLDLFDIRWQ